MSTTLVFGGAGSTYMFTAETWPYIVYGACDEFPVTNNVTITFPTEFVSRFSVYEYRVYTCTYNINRVNATFSRPASDIYAEKKPEYSKRDREYPVSVRSARVYGVTERRTAVRVVYNARGYDLGRSSRSAAGGAGVYAGSRELNVRFRETINAWPDKRDGGVVTTIGGTVVIMYGVAPTFSRKSLRARRHEGESIRRYYRRWFTRVN